MSCHRFAALAVSLSLSLLLFGFPFGRTVAGRDVSAGLRNWLLAKPQSTTPLPEPAPRVQPPELSAAESDPTFYVRYAPVYAATVGGSETTDAIPDETANSSVDIQRVPPPDDGDRDIVQFAGGAIEFPVPHGWVVTEANVGRAVRLYLTPAENEYVIVGNSHVWVTYHVANHQTVQQAELIRVLSTQWRRSLPENTEYSDAGHTTVGPRSAVREECRFALANEDNATISLHGVHWLIPVEWGIVELYALHRANDDIAWSKTKELLSELNVGLPARGIEHARSFVGAWKAERSRLLLTVDGNVHLEYDAPRPRRIDAQTSLATTPPRRLSGRFEARDDLLHITWQDGSRLNLRWQLVDGRLHLTDHLGRVSQLHRLLENR